MSGPSLDLVALALQVTVPALAALALASRLHPAAASRTMTWAVGVVLVMSALAFVPLPGWPALAPVRSVSPDAAPVVTALEGAPGRAELGSRAVPGVNALRALRSLYASFRAGTDAGAGTLNITGMLVLFLAALGLLRLGFGWVSAWSLGYRAVPVKDPALLDRVRSLAAGLGCRRPLRVRESGQVAGAATVGWRRPVLLLASDWRGWADLELNAVLAHEVSHVARGDYAVRLAARLAAALHGYHPLVRLLAARLSFAQERAADERAADAVGGRAAYVRLLAAVALRTDRPFTAGGAPAFLSEPRTLLRRIAMLRVKDDTASPRRGRLSVALVLALGAAALGLRVPAAATRAAGEVSAPPGSRSDRPPLDVSLAIGLDEKDLRGAYAIRVGQVLRAPELARQKEAINRVFRGESAPLPGVDTRFGLPIEDVEQVAGRVYHRVEDKPPPNQTLMLSLHMVRATHDFDWFKQLQQSFGRVNERKYHGKKYYEVEKNRSQLAAFFGALDRALFYIPDGRTLVFDNEKNIRRLIDAAQSPSPTPSWLAGWEGVQSGLAAFALRDPGEWARKSLEKGRVGGPPADPEEKEMIDLANRLLKSTDRLLVGLDAAEGYRIELKGAAPNLRAATEGAEALRGILQFSRHQIAADANRATDSLSRLFRRSILDALGNAVVETDGKAFTLRVSAGTGMHEILEAAAAAIPPLK